MTERQQFVDEQGPVARMEYTDDTTVLAADVGPGRDATVDLLDDVAIVVVGDEQYEFEVPGDGDAQAFIRNGVLTVEVEG